MCGYEKIVFSILTEAMHADDAKPILFTGLRDRMNTLARAESIASLIQQRLI
jgi:hypothetical protein